MNERICPHCGKPIKNPQTSQKYHKKCAAVVSAERRPHYKSQTEWRIDKVATMLDQKLHDELSQEQEVAGHSTLSDTIAAIKAQRDALLKKSL